jgi:hypothetical protein
MFENRLHFCDGEAWRSDEEGVVVSTTTESQRLQNKASAEMEMF